MAIHDLQETDGAVLATVSGARIEMLSPDLTQAFFDRLGLADFRPTTNDVAWGAFEDAGPLIGVGVLGEATSLRARAWIAVVPERRRLGVGSELLGLVAAAAKELGLGYLTYRHCAGDAAPHHLARSLGLPLARRVNHGGTWTVIVLSRHE